MKSRRKASKAKPVQKSKSKQKNKNASWITRTPLSLPQYLGSILTLIQANAPLGTSRSNYGQFETAEEWVGRNVGFLQPPIWRKVLESKEMAEARAYCKAWKIGKGSAPTLPKHLERSIWRQERTRKAPSGYAIGDGWKPSNPPQVPDLNAPEIRCIWTCSGGLPSLGKRG